MAKFEVVSAYADRDIHIPVRGTAQSAGYDFEVAEDTIIPPMEDLLKQVAIGYYERDKKEHPLNFIENIIKTPEPLTLGEMAAITKEYKAKPTLVPTGIKCKLSYDEYLKLVVRSSCPLKYWLTIANCEGIIDADYYNNPDNEGAIYFQVINLSPLPILLKKGDKIGQGIIQKYIITEDDAAAGERVGGFGSTGENTRT